MNDVAVWNYALIFYETCRQCNLTTDLVIIQNLFAVLNLWIDIERNKCDAAFFLKLFPKFIIFLRLTLWLLICHVDFNIRTLQSWVARKEFILFKKHFQSVQVFLVTYINNQLFDLFFSFLVPWTVVKDSLSNNFKICSNTATTVPQRNLISFCNQEMIRKLRSTHLTTSWQMNCNCCPLRYWYTPFA